MCLVHSRPGGHNANAYTQENRACAKKMLNINTPTTQSTFSCRLFHFTVGCTQQYCGRACARIHTLTAKILAARLHNSLAVRPQSVRCGSMQWQHATAPVFAQPQPVISHYPHCKITRAVRDPHYISTTRLILRIIVDIIKNDRSARETTAHMHMPPERM